MYSVFKMVINIKELETADTEQPSSSIYSKTQESNLDTMSLSGSLNLQLLSEDEVLYQDALGNNIFKGLVRNIEIGDSSKYIIFDYGIELGEIPVKVNYKNKTPIEIIEDVITNYTSLTFVNLSGVTTTRTIPLYPTGDKFAIQIINDMHKILGTTHSVDNSKNFNLEIEGFETNSITLEVGINCDLADKSKGWESSTSFLCDGITVNGDNKRIEEIELLSGTGSQTTFTLSNPFTDIKVEHPIGILLTAEVEDVTTGDYRINKETAEVIFNIAPSSGTDNIKVYYVYEIPVNFTIDGTGSNPHHKIINEKYLKEVEDCISYAEKYRKKFQNPIKNCQLIYKNNDSSLFKANQIIRVVDSYHKVNGSYIDDNLIIKSVNRQYGNGVAELILTVGNSTIFNFNKDKEIEKGINDLNQSITSADIFNEGVGIIGENNVLAQTSSNVKLFIATLPQDILVYNIARKYSSETEYNGYKYINGSDYLELFDEVRE